MRIYFFRRFSILLKLTLLALISLSIHLILKSSRIGFTLSQDESCIDRSPETQYTTRSNGDKDNYTVINNYFKGEKHFRCNESITYTTHGEWPSLDNLIPLLERWQGPISFSVYCPGYDFHDAMKVIQYLRECQTNQLVKNFVTFHMIFDTNQNPEIMGTSSIPSNPELLPVSCVNVLDEIAFPSSKDKDNDNATSFKEMRGLQYPINIARNVARENAMTHFVLASDVELFPSLNLIPDFLEMIRKAKNNTDLQKKVFVLPVFELHDSVTRLPESKRELLEYLELGVIVIPHQYGFTMLKEWRRSYPSSGTGNLNVFRVLKKRNMEVEFWEPVFIGTNREPFYDEKLNLEGTVSQAFAMCLLDYEFHILDNAFLVHQVVINKNKTDFENIPEDVKAEQRRENKKNMENIRSQVLKLYGKSEDEKC